MNTFVQAVTVLLPTAYLAAALLHGMAFAGERQPPFATRLRAPVLAATLALHLTMFLARAQVAGAFPIIEVWLTVSATAWLVALIYALVAARAHVPAVGGIVLVMVGLLQAGASMFGSVRASPQESVDPGTVLHVVTVVPAAAALVLSGLFGSLHLLLLRQMRERSFGPVYRELPNLEQLVRLTRKTALMGFVFLGAGLNLGIAMAHQRSTDGINYLDPDVLITIVIWLHFGLIAFSRRIRGITARRASIAAVGGLVVLLMTLALALFPVATVHQVP